MLEWADGRNLRNLWNTVERPSMTQDLVRETVGQLLGLAWAVSTAHYPPNYPDRDTMSFRHGDLEPENILWFFDASEQNSEKKKKIGTLKIGDWGLAKTQSVVTKLRTNNTTTGHGTRRYESPEEVIGITSSDLLGPTKSGKTVNRRSRLYDIWSMGCITLEFLIWLMYGNEELKRFSRAIGTDDTERSRFYHIQRDERGQVIGKATVRDAVVKWMDHMAEDPICASSNTGSHSTALGDLLRLIKYHLLVVDLPENMAVSPQYEPGKRVTANIFMRKMKDIADKIPMDLQDSAGYWPTGQANPPIGPNHERRSPEKAGITIDTRNNEHIQGTKYKDLPTTLRNAVTKNRATGHPYLRIDSISVIQGKGGVFDKGARRIE